MSDTEPTPYVCSRCKARYPIGLIVAWDGRLYCVWHAPKDVRAEDWRKRLIHLVADDEPWSLF